MLKEQNHYQNKDCQQQIFHRAEIGSGVASAKGIDTDGNQAQTDGHDHCAGDHRREEAAQRISELNINAAGTEVQAGTFSGGNQQRVVIAKWLTRNCDILIFDEPTRGIDVGAKNEIYKLMNQLAEQGKAIIMISSEMTEILRMSDRIVVMCEGKKTGELDISEATQENIMNMATREIE